MRLRGKNTFVFGIFYIFIYPHRQRPDRDPVRRSGRQPQHGHEVQPQRLRPRHRGHHQPGWPCLRQDGPFGAQRRVPVQERHRRQVSAYFRGRRGLFQDLMV